MPAYDHLAVKRRFSKNLSDLRAESGHSRKGLAELAGLAPRDLERLEGGRNEPGVMVLIRLAAALNPEDPDAAMAGLVEGLAWIPPEYEHSRHESGYGRLKESALTIDTSEAHSDDPDRRK